MQEAQAGLVPQGEDRAHRLVHHMFRWVAQQIARPPLNEAQLQHEGRTLALVEEPLEEVVEGVDERLSIVESQRLRPKRFQGQNFMYRSLLTSLNESGELGASR